VSKLTDNLHDFLRSRRSVRRFKPEAVDAALLTRILETATYAPSAHNHQPWRFAALTGPEQKSRLGGALAGAYRRDLTAEGMPAAEIEARASRAQSQILEAPVVIVLCMDVSEMRIHASEKLRQGERLLETQSAALAGLQLQLAVHAEGLGSVWMCRPVFAPEAVRKVLDLPETWEPQAMFFIGYPDEQPKPKVLKPVNEVVRFV
jgi:F420 biosynthesis protein FbiB-like protein